MKSFICQSCGFPFSKESCSTNRDRTVNHDFCTDCFSLGQFTNQHLTLHEMERRLLEMAKEHNDMSLQEAQEIIRVLPGLKRWKMTKIL